VETSQENRRVEFYRGASASSVFCRRAKLTSFRPTQMTNAFAWDETARLIEEDCIEGDWEKAGVKGKDGKFEVKIDSAVVYTRKLQLLVSDALRRPQRRRI
jgi:hypothetical protein